MATQIEDVVRQFLFASNTTPSDFANEDLIGGSGTRAVSIDTKTHIENEGRFALASRSALVESFFSNDYDPETFFTGDETEVSWDKTSANNLFNGGNFFGITIDHKDFGGDSDADTREYAERVYIFGNTRYKVNDAAEFKIYKIQKSDGSFEYKKVIENFAIVPREDENFDFSSSDPTTEATQVISRRAIDPSAIGRTVALNFDNSNVEYIDYDINNFNDDKVTETNRCTTTLKACSEEEPEGSVLQMGHKKYSTNCMPKVSPTSEQMVATLFTVVMLGMMLNWHSQTIRWTTWT